MSDLTKGKNFWFDETKILSYKALINVIVGMRGGGKTYGFKKRVIKDYFENDNQFVWVRRYKTQLDETMKTFFDAIRYDEELVAKYGEFKGEVRGNDIYINDDLAGTFISLTTASKYKGSDYPRIKKVIFDEFIEEEGSAYYYRKNEVNTLYGLIETIQRQRDNIQVVLIGNAITFANPYFIEWRIKPLRSEFMHIKERSIVIQMYINENFMQHKLNTRFGKLTAGTEYSNYAIHNKFIDVSDIFVASKSDLAKYRCTVKYDGENIGFWLDRTEGIMYATNKIDPSSNYSYVLSQKDHDINYYLVKNIKGTMINEIVQCYQMGVLRFQDVRIKARVLEMLLLFTR